MTSSLLDAVRWNEKGLVPVVTQDQETGVVLMLAWMNAQALEQTISSGWVVYWSRSRQSLWQKGEQSGHRQRLIEARLDCDGDTLLLKVDQLGGIACHTGRQNCFYRVYNDDEWRPIDPVLKSPSEIYSESSDE